MLLTDAEPKRAYRTSDIFHELLAEILEYEIEPIAQMIPHTAKRGTTAFGQAFKAGGDIDAIAKDVTVLHHDVADIDADPKAHGRLRVRSIGYFQRLLNSDRARDRVEHARELGQHAVAGGGCNPDAMIEDQVVDCRAARRKRRHRRLFVAVYQAAIVLDIGGDDRGKLPFELGCLHRASRLRLDCLKRTPRGTLFPKFYFRLHLGGIARRQARTFARGARGRT